MLMHKKVIFHSWLLSIVSCIVIYGLLLFFVYKDYQNTQILKQVKLLTKEYRVEDIERITLCSIREFSGKVATGKFSGTNMVAVSPDLKKYLNWYAIIPNVSNEIFYVSDLTNNRLRSTVDIYTYQPSVKAKEFGVKKGKILFISSQGLYLLGKI